MRDNRSVSIPASLTRCADSTPAPPVASSAAAAAAAISVRRTTTVTLITVSDYRGSYVTIISMSQPFTAAAVLGAGTMGAQIAAHLANAGVSVTLLDVSREAAA